MPEIKKILVYWPYFQHYHLARLQSLKLLCEANGIQLVAIALSRQSTDLHESVQCSDLSELVYLDEASGGQTKGYGHLRKFIRECRPNCILINGYAEHASRAILLEARSLNIACVLMSDSKYDDAPRNVVKERIKQALVKSFGGALVASSHASSYLKILGLPKKYHYMPYDVVDNAYWSKSVVEESGGYLLSIGRFIPKKNFANLIEAYAKVQEKTDLEVPKLRIVGAGPEEFRLKQLVENLSLGDKVSIEPYRKPTELRQIYHGARLFVLASNHEEQWGLVVNEAIAAGVPVLASEKIGAVPDLVEHSVTGWTFDPYRVSSIEDALSYALRSPGQMKAYNIEAQRRLKEKFSCDNFAQAALFATETACSRQPAIKTSWLDVLILKLLGLLPALSK